MIFRKERSPNPPSGKHPGASGPYYSHLLLALVVLTLLLTPQPAQAYVDPGAGTMIWQMLVAGFLGAAFYIRRLIPNWRSRKKGPPSP